MSLFKAVSKIIKSVGKFFNEVEEERNREKYIPKYDGQWVNKGSRYNENWEWKDNSPKTLRPYWVLVFNYEDDYIITIGFHPRKNAIDGCECENDREVEIAISLLQAKYSVLGNVIVNKTVESEESEFGLN